MAAQRQIRVEGKFPPDLPPFLADADLLSRAVENLVSNAIKYSPDATVVASRRAPRKSLSLSKWPTTGYGIPAADLERVFEKFYRVPRVQDAGVPGTGLGLALVREIAELHHGSVSVGAKSTKGPSSLCGSPAMRSARRHNLSTQSHILIADDERSIRLMLETGLTLNGFRVTAVRNGREALEAASAGKFDAVLSDIYMPDMGGLELVDALRATDPNLPIVLMTAQGSLQVAVEAVTRGATDFIGKPFDISAVVDLLRRLLEARREADAVPPPSRNCNSSRPAWWAAAHP